MSKVTLLFIVLLVFPVQAKEQPSKTQLSSILKEAEDYLSVKPSKTLTLLATDINLAPLSEAEFFRWHITLIRASISLNRLSVMEHSIKKLIAHKSTTEFDRRLVSILSSIGIWLRKSGYLEQAKITFYCALVHNKIDKLRIKLLVSIAIVFRHLDQTDSAIKIYNMAKNIVQDKKLTTSLGTIENNLGVLALESNDVVKAEHHFRAALAIYQSNSNRSGNVVSGINLLQAFLIQNQQINYQRLHPSIARLTKAFPNKSRQSTLFWLNTVYQLRQGVKVSNEVKLQLIEKFALISDRKLQFSLKKHFSDELNIDVNLVSKTSQRNLPPLWLNEITQCDWDKLATFKIENLK